VFIIYNSVIIHTYVYINYYTCRDADFIYDRYVIQCLNYGDTYTDANNNIFFNYLYLKVYIQYA